MQNVHAFQIKQLQMNVCRLRSSIVNIYFKVEKYFLKNWVILPFCSQLPKQLLVSIQEEAYPIILRTTQGRHVTTSLRIICNKLLYYQFCNTPTSFPGFSPTRPTEHQCRHQECDPCSLVHQGGQERTLGTRLVALYFKSRCLITT